MANILETLVKQFTQNSALELAAVVLAIAYLLLAVRQNIACWYAAFVSTAIFLWIFWNVQLYMESGLQVFYLIMAVYGWYRWRASMDEAQIPIISWPMKYHVACVTAVLAATAVSGTLLQGSDQRLAYIDSFTTWGAILTTFMVAHKVLENWLYWLVIDSVSIYLYLDRELYFTALLFLAYLFIVIAGYIHWRRDYWNQAKSAGLSGPA